MTLRRKRRAAAALCLLLLIEALAAFADEATFSNQSVTGLVTGVSGSEVTIQLGEVTSQAPGGEPPQSPGGELSQTPGFLSSGESLTFTVTDATAVAVEEAGSTRDGTAQDIAQGSLVRVVFGQSQTVASVTVLASNAPGVPGAQADNGTAATTIAQDGAYASQTYSSTGDDENALRIDGATVELTGVVIDKSGGACSSAENGELYGANAGLLSLNGAQVVIDGATVSTAAQSGNGVFSYGQGTSVTVQGSAITTLADNSSGLQTAGGGAAIAQDCTVETSGDASAAVRSGRGGGALNVTGGSYTTHGADSPAIYSAAQTAASGATLTAGASEAVVVEGAGSVTLTDCIVSGNTTGAYMGDGTENIHSVMLYRSASAAAQDELSSFEMTGGSLTSGAGVMFYVTNTQAQITLTSVALAQAEGAKLLCVEGNSGALGWGEAGRNGAQVAFTANAQTLEGEVTVDAISTLEFVLSGGSTFEGSICIVENAQGGAAVGGNAHVVVGEGCVWTLSGDSSVSTLENNGTIVFGGYTITLADGTVLSQ